MVVLQLVDQPGSPALARGEGIAYESQKLLEGFQRMFRARRRVWVDGFPVLNRQPMEIDAAQAGMPRFVVREEQPAVRGAALLAGGSAGVYEPREMRYIRRCRTRVADAVSGAMPIASRQCAPP